MLKIWQILPGSVEILLIVDQMFSGFSQNAAFKFSENSWKKVRWKFESSKKFESSRKTKVRKFKKVRILSSTQILICNPGTKSCGWHDRARRAGGHRRGPPGGLRVWSGGRTLDGHLGAGLKGEPSARDRTIQTFQIRVRSKFRNFYWKFQKIQECWSNVQHVRKKLRNSDKFSSNLSLTTATHAERWNTILKKIANIMIGLF